MAGTWPDVQDPASLVVADRSHIGPEPVYLAAHYPEPAWSAALRADPDRGDGNSYEDTANICGCALGTVKEPPQPGTAKILEDLGESSWRSPIEASMELCLSAGSAQSPRER